MTLNLIIRLYIYITLSWNILIPRYLITTIIIIITENGPQCKAGCERLTQYQSDDPSLTIQTPRKKEEKEKLEKSKREQTD